MDRRHFLTTAALAIPSLSFAANQGLPKKTPKIYGFSKAFMELDAAKTAALVEEVGWDGIDIPVRAESSHIPLDKAGELLPQYIDELKKRGKEVGVVATSITRLGKGEEKFLKLIAKLGIKKYRLGFVFYKPNDNPLKVAREYASALKDIAAFNKENDLWAGYQNHSGTNLVGGPIWDIMLAMENTNPKHLGLFYDIAHSTVEGGEDWVIQSRLARPRIGVANVKDYRWREERKDDGGTDWHRDATPFGTGIVRKKFFTDLMASGFDGPFSQHFEYDLGDEKQRIANFKRDLTQLRQWIS